MGPAIVEVGSGKPGDKEAGRTKQRIANALNSAISADWPFPPLAELKADTRQVLAKERNSRRGRRLILEDLFGRAIARDVASSYVIRWKPEFGDEAVANEILGGLFGKGRTESITLTADKLLKAFSSGGGLPEGVPAFGHTEVSLCSEQFRDEVQQGVSYVGNEYVSYFNFDLGNDTNRGLPGEEAWFKMPHLFVSSKGVSGSATPACAERFASSLNANLPRLLTDGGRVGATLRDLQTLLTVNRIAGWLIGVAPLDQTLFAPVEKGLKNLTPAVIHQPIVVASGGKIAGIEISGGVRLDNNAPEPGRPAADAIGKNPSARSMKPAFEITTVTIDGRRFLKIDASAILGLEPN
jgi:hypothetical protein